jgi:acyl-CoA thioesterase I
MVINKKIGLLIIVVMVVSIIGWWFFRDHGNDSALKAVVPRPNTEAEITIIAFGDSLTAGYGLPASESYPAQLERILVEAGHSVRVINAGVSGETTRGNRERAEFIRQQNPDIVLLGTGGNDALRQLPIAETRNNVASTIETLQSGTQSPVVILLSMQAPLTSGLSYKQEFDDMYNELADRYNLPLADFITSEVFLDNTKKLPDGIHLNREGYEIVARDYILPVVEQVLERFSG